MYVCGYVCIIIMLKELNLSKKKIMLKELKCSYKNNNNNINIKIIVLLKMMINDNDDNNKKKTTKIINKRAR